MPQTLNGIGTSYFRKSNVLERQAVCEFCGRLAKIKSYDTMYVFCVLFIPLVPLGRKRILNDCQTCRRHRVMPLAEWQQLSARLDQSVRDTLAETSPNVDRMIETIGVATMRRDKNLLTQLQALTARSYSRDVGALASMADAHYEIGELAESCKYLQQLLAFSETAAHRHILAARQLEAGQLDSAIENYRKSIPGYPSDKSWVIGELLVQKLQADANHNEALRLLGDIERAYPDLRTNKAFAKRTAISTEHRTTGQAIKPTKSLVNGYVFEKKQHGKKILIAAAVIGLIAAGYAGVCGWLGGNRSAYLLNGTASESRISVNGSTYTLAANAMEKIRIPGDTPLTIEQTVGADGTLPTQTLTVAFNDSFLARPFNQKVIVINPDRTGLLVVETIRYQDNRNMVSSFSADGPPPQLITPAAQHSFQDIDYKFTTPPQKIEMKKGSTIEDRRSLRLVTELGTPMEKVSLMLRETNDITRAQAYAADCFQADPSQTDLLGLALSGNADAVMPALRPQLQARPVSVDVHRVYQEYRKRIDQEKQVIAEYRSHLQANPDNPQFQYLLARLIDDRAEGDKLLDQAIAATPPEAYAFFARGYRQSAAGDFAGALASYARARELRQGVYSFSAMWFEMLVATRRYDEALKYLDETNPTNVPNVSVAAERAQLQKLNLKTADAIETLNRESDRMLAAKYERADIDRGTRMIRIAMSYDSPGERAKHFLQSDMPGHNVVATILAGRPAEALSAYEGLESKSFDVLALIYVVADSAGNHDTARAALAMMKNVQAGWQPEERKVTALITGPTASLADLDRVDLDPLQRSIALTALGRAHRSIREECNTLAQKLYYRRDWPLDVLSVAWKSSR